VRSIGKLAWLLALASGGLQALVFPKPALYFLCWVAVAPLLIAILQPLVGSRIQVIPPAAKALPARTAKQGFLLGYASGIVWYGGTCYWVFHVMNIYGGLSAPFAAVLLVLFCLYLGLYHGLFGALLVLAARSPRIGPQRVLLLAPFVWVAVELARARITGFPWNLLGTAQVDNGPLTQFATVTGVYGISFAIVLVNAAFAAALLFPIDRRRAMAIAAVASAVVLQAGALVEPEPQPTTHAATLVQHNTPVDASLQWTVDVFESTLRELGQLSMFRSGERQPALVIWPESPSPFYENDPGFRRTMSALAQDAQAHFIIGTIGVRPAAEHGRQVRGQSEVFNSASLITPAGDWQARYDKIHLVPFGEYIPLQSLLTFAEKLTRQVGDFGRGATRQPFTVNGQKIGVFICYESVFPAEVRQFALNGASVLVNISNDGWFGDTGAPGQHLNMARMRAVENRRWLLRSTNTGITAAIDPYGRVTQTAPRYQRIAITVDYAPVAFTTWYTRHGDWFAWACAIIAGAAIFFRFNFTFKVLR
jgi:apolipoprotein N-acyltransferase